MNNNITRKLTKKESILRVFGLLLIIISFIIFIIVNYFQGNKIYVQNNIIKSNDSLIVTQKNKSDSINKIETRTDSIKRIVYKYLELRNNHNAQNIEFFYSDTLLKYFNNSKTKISRQEVTKLDTEIWKNDPNDRIDMIDSIDIASTDENFKSIIKVKYCDKKGCNNYILYIGFSKENKINLVRAYKAE